MSPIENILGKKLDFASLLAELYLVRYHGRIMLDFNFGVPTIVAVCTTQRLILDKASMSSADS